MVHFDDGTYDVVVVEAETRDGELLIDLVITLGPRVGEIVSLRGHHLDERAGHIADSDPHRLLGLCGTLRVRNGVPSFRPERA
jgi:integrase